MLSRLILLGVLAFLSIAGAVAPRKLFSVPPPVGTNVVAVTHRPNIMTPSARIGLT